MGQSSRMHSCELILVVFTVFVTGKNKETEDLSEFLKDGKVLYKTLWEPKDCAGPTQDGDDIKMIMKYPGQKEVGKEVEMEHTLTTKMGKGQPIRNAGDGLYRMCLGEQRQLRIPEYEITRYKTILPGIVEGDNILITVELIILNKSSWHKSESGLQMALLEPVQDEFCSRTVIVGDTLYVEYEGTLENGTVFDSSQKRGNPFGPFIHGHNQIIDGYTEALNGRCLGERWRMTVPPHLAHGDDGVVEDNIPGGATLTFDVRLIQLNEDIWSDEVMNKKVFKWEVIEKPEVCKEIVGDGEKLFMHYEAIREDKSRFGTIGDNIPPFGPFSLAGQGTFVPALNQALPGMCLGEKRLVAVVPRMGWASGHHDTIQVEVVLVGMNGKEADILKTYQRKSRGRRGESGKIEL